MDRSRELPLGTPPRLEVGGFVIDFGREALFDSRGMVVELRPQAFRVLSHLALNAGRLVTKEELFSAVWGGAVVTDDSMIQAIGDVRHALSDAERRVIKTIPRRGYILVGAEVIRESAAPRFGPRTSRHMAALIAIGALLAVLVAIGVWHGIGRLYDAPTSSLGCSRGAFNRRFGVRGAASSREALGVGCCFGPRLSAPKQSYGSRSGPTGCGRSESTK